jgi:acid stress chaperone HdeB
MRPLAICLGLAAAVVLFCSPQAKAQVMLDVSKITCGQFVAYKIANPKYLSVWISGYYHGMHKKLVVDTQRLLDNADKLENYCLKNPDILVLPAVETVLGPLE